LPSIVLYSFLPLDKFYLSEQFVCSPHYPCTPAGASEENIRVLFKKAYRTAPSIVFIDEIDAIASKRENLQREMERRIVTQLMTCMDEFHQNAGSDGADLDSQSSEKKPGYVIVIGATNRPDAVDQALRRPGRFDREISLGVPDEHARKQILTMLTQNLTLEADGRFDLFKIARATPGFVGADLKALVDKAGNLAMKRIIIKRKKRVVGVRRTTIMTGGDILGMKVRWVVYVLLWMTLR
jgi:ribosome biogenesis ATPase